MQEVDVAIVGGGPAGMVAACLLSRAGLKTLVLERNSDFSREFRGEILQPRFQRAMQDIGLYDAVNACPHEEIDGAHIYFHGLRVGRINASRLDPQHPKIWWMTQPDLLNGLDQFARKFSSYEIQFGSSVKKILPDRTLEIQKDGKTFNVRAKVIIGADGRFSKMKTLGGFQTRYDHHDFDVVWFLVDRPVGYKHFFSFFLAAGSTFLILPKHPNQLQCGMVFRSGGFDQIKKSGIESFKKTLEKGHPAFSKFARTVNDFSAFHPLRGNRSLVEKWVKDGVMLIGDAAHTCSPAGGIGVAIAVETAAVAAQVILEGFKKNDLSDEQLGIIQKQRENQIKIVHAIQGQARIILNPIFKPFRLFALPIIALLSITGVLPFFAKRLLAQQKPLPSF